MSKEELQTIFCAGVTSIQVGIESLNSDIQSLMNKGISLLQSLYFLKCCREIGMDVHYNHLIGIPHETKEQYKKIMDLIPLITHLQPPSYPPTPIILERYSEYFNYPNENGIFDIKPCKQYEIIFPNSIIDVNEIAMDFSFMTDLTLNDGYTLLTFGELVRQWNVDFYSDSRASLIYKLEESDIVVYDSRSGKLESQSLNKAVAYILIYCRRIRTFESICRFASNKSSLTSASIVRKILDSLLEDGFVVEENDRYLTLVCATDMTSQST